MATRKRRAPTRRTSTRRTTTRRTAARRRSTPALSTTLGAALGTLVVTALLDASWPVRIGLIVAVVVLGLAYVLWKHRAEIAAGASEAPAEGEPTPPGTAAAPPPETRAP